MTKRYVLHITCGLVLLVLAGVLPVAAAEEYFFIDKWGARGTGDGEFWLEPRGLTVDNGGYVYVTDSGGRYFDLPGGGSTGYVEFSWIHKFSTTGTFVTKFGGFGSGDGQFRNAQGVAVDDAGYVYVADTYNHRIQKLDANGNYISKLGGEGSGDGQLLYPYGVAVDHMGNIYVVDYGNHRVQKFDADGNFLLKWGTQGSSDGQFNSPRCASIDASGNVYVTDEGNYRVQKFDSNGNFLLKWGSQRGAGPFVPGTFGMLMGIACNAGGDVYAVDYSYNTVQKFDSTGTFITLVCDMGWVDGDVSLPWGVGVDNDGYVYVADGQNTRVQKFALASSSTTPVAHDDAFTSTEDQDLEVAAPGVLLNDEPATGVIAQLTGGPSHGTLTLNPVGSFTYRPATDFAGTDTFTYTVIAGTPTSAPATVTITVNPVNDPPVANGATATTEEDTPLAIALSGFDIDGNPLSYSVVAPPAHGSLSGAAPALTYTPAANYNGPDAFTFTVNDGSVDSPVATVSLTVRPVNDPPAVVTDTAIAGDEGSPLAFDASRSADPDGDTLSYLWDYGDGQTSNEATCTHAYADDETFPYPASITISDGTESVTKPVAVTIANICPTITAFTVPVNLLQIGTPVTVGTSFSDPGVRYPHSATWTWGDGTTEPGTVTESAGEGSVSDTHTYSVPGVYTIRVEVTDHRGATDTAESMYIVVYDPNGGFVTGGGWIDSPAGAYTADAALTGKATFGFVSKYQKGATVPTGQTQFVFKAADFTFHSTSYEWLVIAGAKAQYKGSGTVNGAGDYGFMLTAIDGQVNGKDKPDLFRLKVWEKATGAIVYDNKMNAPDSDDPTTAIGGGSIVIHKG